MSRIPVERPRSGAGRLGAAVCAVFLALSHHVAARGQGAAETLEARIAESRTYGEATLAALGEADRTKIAAGRPVALLEDIPESPVKIGKGIGVIPYPPEVVWQVLNDYSNYKEFMPFTKESTVDLVRSGGDTVYFSSELSVPLLNDRYYSLKITSEENVEGQRRTYFISWTLDPERSSNLYLNSGSWKLVPYGPEGNRTLAFYTVITDPGGNIPNFLKDKSTAVAIPSVFEAISNRARDGLAARLYTAPLPEDALEALLQEKVEASRSFDLPSLETLSPQERKALEEGDVIVNLEELKGTWVKMAHAVALVDAPSPSVWKTISSYAQYKQFMPYVAESTVDASRSKGNVVYLSYRLHFVVYPYIKDRYCTIKVTDESGASQRAGTYFIHWSLAPSRPYNINRNCGSWKLVPYGQDGSKTLVSYTVLADPGGISPWFWRNISAKKAVYNVFEAIRKKARAQQPHGGTAEPSPSGGIRE